MGSQGLTLGASCVQHLQNSHIWTSPFFLPSPKLRAQTSQFSPLTQGISIWPSTFPGSLGNQQPLLPEPEMVTNPALPF